MTENIQNIDNNGLDLTTYHAAYGAAGDSFKVTNDFLIFKRTAATGNGGFGYYLETDTTKDVYITMVAGSTNNSLSYRITGPTTLGDLRIRFDDSKIVGKKVTPCGVNLLVYRFTPSDFIQANLSNKFGVLFTIAGAGTAILKNLTVSNTIGLNANYQTQNDQLENVNLREKTEIGQAVDILSSATLDNHSGLQFGTFDNASNIDNGVLKEVDVYAPTAGDYIFKTGQIDQNNLLVSEAAYTWKLQKGYNHLDLEYANIPLESGYRLFADLSALGTYVPDETHARIFTSLIQDDVHSTANPTYSGFVFYSCDTLLPFSYSVIESGLDRKLDNVNQRIDLLANRLESVESFTNTVSLTSPNGNKYAVQVDNDGKLTVYNPAPVKVLIIGNSLTITRGAIGMAASDPDHDYYALLRQKFIQQNPKAVVQPRLSAAQWETETTSLGRQMIFDTVIAPALDADTDVVIIQLIDNVNSDDKKATFKADAETLIKNIKNKAPKARVFWIARWFADENLLADLKEVCQAAGATQIDITDIARMSDTKSFIGAKRTGKDGTTWTVESSGEAAHPGDKGMQLIADRISEAILGR